METALIVLCGYLAGSLPFGYWIGRLRGVDIRTVGSGNIGATNVWRTLGPTWGIPVALLDALKGFVPALVGSLALGPLAGVLAGSAAMLGHWRPLFLGFRRGGKIVATTGGVLFGVAPYAALVSVVVWLVVFAPLRYASLASIAAAVAMVPAAVVLGYSWPVLVFVSAAALAVIVLHRANIRRLLAGTEHRVDLRRKKSRGSASHVAAR